MKLKKGKKYNRFSKQCVYKVNLIFFISVAYYNTYTNYINSLHNIHDEVYAVKDRKKEKYCKQRKTLL